MKVLLVNATYTREVIEVGFPPLGLAYIASSLRKAFGNTILFKVVDRDIAEHITAFKPDIVGISSVTKNYNIAKEHAQIAKQIFDLPVIIGGAHISFMPQNLTLDMDVGIAFEGEETIVELMKSYLSNGRFDKAELHGIDGLIFRDNGVLFVTRPREFIQTLGNIDYPARDLIRINESTSMLTSRGCPYYCAFCSTSRLWGNKIRFAPAEYVAEEIDLVYKRYGAKLITIYDDMFVSSTRRVADIIEELKKKKAFGKVAFQCNIRPDNVTEELAEALHEMNVHAVGMGLESGSQKIIDYLKTGGITVEQNIKAIAILKKHRIIPYCSFIVGSPQDDRDTIRKTIKFVEDNKVNHFDFHVLTPYPGTPVWDYAKERGLVSNDMNWNILNMQGGPTPESIILSEHLSRDEVIDTFWKMEKRKRGYQRKANALAIIKNPRILWRKE